jgi:hypothetical protein
MSVLACLKEMKEVLLPLGKEAFDRHGRPTNSIESFPYRRDPLFLSARNRFLTGPEKRGLEMAINV